MWSCSRWRLSSATTTGAAEWGGRRTARRADTFLSTCASSSLAPRFSASAPSWREDRNRPKPSLGAISPAGRSRSSFRRCCSACFMQWLGLYVASFLLIAGFMRIIGRIALWKSLLTAALFALVMFATFDVRVRRHHAQGTDRRLLRTLAMEALTLLMQGFAVLLTWKILALMIVGLVLGIFVGVAAGVWAVPNGVAILLPLTFTMNPTAAIVMLSCIYWGALFGGAITSILFNIRVRPGRWRPPSTAIRWRSRERPPRR